MMNLQKKKSILLICAGYLSWILLDTFFWLNYGGNSYSFVLKHNSARLAYGLIICILFALVQRNILTRRSSGRAVQFSLVTFAVLAFALVLAVLNIAMTNFWSSGKFTLQTNGFFWTALFNCVVLFSALTGLFYADYYRDLTARQKEQIVLMKSLADEAQLLMLRYQINPHFLFNSLNAIQSMIEKDRERAKEMIADLSDFFRYTLSKNDRMLVPFREELDAVRKYLAIQKERFAGRIAIEYSIDSDCLEIMLPFFIVHPLVENAIKYGLPADGGTLRLTVEAARNGETLSILIKNTGSLIPDLQESAKRPAGTKTGIENLKKRLSLFYPDRCTFELFEQEGCVCALIKIMNPGMSS